MSKISIEGNSLGTGTLTIAAPNTNTNRTLNLPDSSGTVVVTGGAQTIEFAAGTASAPSITTTGDTNTGIFFPAADTIAFAEGGAEAMRVNSNGTLLVNSTATTPSGVANIKMNVVGQQMYTGAAGATTTQSDTAKGVINFRATTGSGSNTENWANFYPGVFMDVVVESGNDGLANSALMIRGQRGGATNPGPYIRCGAGNQSSSNFTQEFRVSIDGGNVANVNGVYGSLSDVRLKQDITDASSQWEDIKAVRVRKFRMKSDFELAKQINAANPGFNKEPPYYIGAIAQELEEVSPGLIEHEGGPDNMKVIKYSILYMKAIKALQEAMGRIETLEAKVTALENS